METNDKKQTENKPRDKRYKISPEAVAILNEKLQLKSNAEIAREYHTTEQRVARILNREEVQKLMAVHQNKLFTLMDKAITALEDALDKKDAQTALQVIKGFGFLNTAKKITVEHKPSDKTATIKSILQLLGQDATIIEPIKSGDR